jgi:ribosomal protein L37AE/L43A
MKWLKARWSSARPWIWSYTKWSFLALIAASAILALWEVRVLSVTRILVDPHDTRKRCPACNQVSGKNRIRRDVFLCDECGDFDHGNIVGAKNIRSGALVIAREVSVAADSRVRRETSSIYNRGAEAERFIDIQLGRLTPMPEVLLILTRR